MTRGPQWSPLSTSGATTATYGDQPLTMTEPQWSPLSTSGATRVPPAPRSPSARRNGARSRRAGRRGDRAKVVTGLDAAMEPALDERGDRRGPATAANRTAAAMEPALDERGDHPRRPERLLRRAGAAMEPALDERGDRPKNSGR